MQCWLFPHGYNLEDFVFTRPPWMERFVLHVWYCQLKLFFTMTVKFDGQCKLVETK